MLERINKLQHIPIHPILWGIYPLTSLYLANIAEIQVRAAGASLVFSLATTLLVFLLIYVSFCLSVIVAGQRSYPRIIIVTAILVVTYFILYRLFKNITFHDIYIFRHRYLIPLWAIVLILALSDGLKPHGILSVLKGTNLLETAAISCSFCLILFFSYGHVFNRLHSAGDLQSGAAIHQILLPIWTAIYLASIFFLRRHREPARLTSALNTLGSLLMIVALMQIVFWKARFPSEPAAESPTAPAPATPSSNSPDLYYIILDGYGRSDHLLEKFNFDNSAFLAELESLGFVIPECTQSNYHLTILSMTSSLNMDYLTELPPGRDADASYLDFEPYLKQSRVLKFFEGLGYETFTFSGINPYTAITNSTHFYDVPEDEDSVTRIDALNFYHLFIQTTALRPVFDYLDQTPRFDSQLVLTLGRLLPFNNDLMNRYYRRYQQNIYHLNVLEGIPAQPGKKFVYAHLYMAHEPFVFTPGGEFREEVTESNEAYIDQIRFLNEKIPGIIRTILEESNTPPIIVLQADHDWGWDNNRARILNAYYLPDGGNAQVYPAISPVNTFRLIINTYFNGDYEMLPDESFTGPYNDFQIKNLTSVPTTCAIP
ncbi:MAG TPA: hypothetical protein VMN99_09375 [Anaerolineales bacterium]|nr:hypothetical protein [Anaerolineales bacterium]